MKYKTINTIIDKVLTSTTLYYSDGLYSLSESGFSAAEIRKTTKLLIVARHHYIERTISLPITIKKDIKAAVEFEFEGLRDEFQLFYKIAQPSDGKCQVMIWQVPKAIIPKGIIMVLPESYLLASLLKPNQLLRYQSLQGRQVMLANTLTHISSSASRHQTMAIFAQASGVSLTEPIEYSIAQLSLHIYNGLFACWQQLASGFWVTPEASKRDWKTLLKPLMIPTIVGSVVYLALSSAFVTYQLQSVESEIEEQKDAISSVLNLQNQIAQLSQQLAQLETVSQQPSPLWRIWQILSPYYTQGVTVKFIRYNDEQVYFSGESPSASNILESMLDNPMVLHPEFSTAVRKQTDNESFIIRFSLASLANTANSAANSIDDSTVNSAANNIDESTENSTEKSTANSASTTEHK
ncbi:hypothetical protein [Shewanella frigidimarina]|uniref:hypothetical protein n=1 Tax=Shewanella frigidimarina TaxID=56812 RepID=UPI003D7ABD90